MISLTLLNTYDLAYYGEVNGIPHVACWSRISNTWIQVFRLDPELGLDPSHVVRASLAELEAIETIRDWFDPEPEPEPEPEPRGRAVARRLAYVAQALQEYGLGRRQVL